MARLLIFRNRVHLKAPEGLTKVQKRNRNAIAHSLSYKKDDYIFTTSYKEKRWDGSFNKYYRKPVKDPKTDKKTYPGDGDSFSTGLLQRVIGAWDRLDGITIVDLRKLPSIGLDKSRPIYQGLRGYQKKAVQALLSNSKCGYQFPRGIIWLPPRTGKTRIAGAILDQLHNYRPAVFVVERRDLARQTVDALEALLGERVGLIGDGVVDIQPITVLTIQSLCAAFKIDFKPGRFEVTEKRAKSYKEVQALVKTCEIFITDESHHASSQSYQKAIQRAGNAWCVFGLSGTPWMDDGSDLLLENALGPILFYRDYTYMIRKGFLAPLSIYFYQLPKVAVYGGSYQAVYKQAVSNNFVKNWVIERVAKRVIKHGKSVAILTTQIQHTHNLAKRIPGAVAITGKERGKVRQDVYKRLATKDLMCVVSNCFNEGIDVPSLDVAINADGGVDSRRIFQRLRVMTPYPGKKRGIFIDFSHLEKHLRKHSNRRLQFYESVPAFDVQVRDVSKKLKEQFKDKVAFG